MTVATQFANLCKLNVASTGTTSPLTLGTAVSGFNGTSVLVNGATYAYTIIGTNTWENGHGVYTASGTTLTRIVDDSSNSGSALSLTGSETIIVGHLLASDAAWMTPVVGSANATPNGAYEYEVSVSDSRATTSSKIFAQVSGSPQAGGYTDELDLEPVFVYGYCTSNGTVRLRLVARGKMFGKYIINYIIS